MSMASRPGRRLGRITSHLRAAAAAAAAAAEHAHGAQAEQVEVVPLALCPGLVDGQLTPLPGALEAVAHAMTDAAEAGDYRRAVELQDLLYVAEKKALLTVEECAPPTPEECGEFFMQNGFVGPSLQPPTAPCPDPAIPEALRLRLRMSGTPRSLWLAVVQNLFEPAQLRRLQASWRRAQGPARQLWHEAKAFGEGQYQSNGVPPQLSLWLLGLFHHLPAQACTTRTCRLGTASSASRSWPTAASSSTPPSKISSQKPATLAAIAMGCSYSHLDAP
jgi:hypothetical protein